MGYRITTLKEHEWQEKAHVETIIEWLHELSEEVMIFKH
jgi:hypothetical protein